jgi:hypothetical protein
MIVLLEPILIALNARKNQVLLIAQAALPTSQFEAFRKLFLDEFGKSGFQQDLERLLQSRKDR